MKTFREGQSSTDAAGAASAPAPVPGKSTLSERLPVQRTQREATPDASPVARSAAVRHKPLAPSAPSIFELFSPGVQMRGRGGAVGPGGAGPSAADRLGGAGTAGKATAEQRADGIHSESLSETTDTGNTYTQELNLSRTTGHVQIQLGIHWVKQGTWADDKAFQTFIRNVKTVVYGYLDNKFKIICTPEAGGAGAAEPRTLTIGFLLYDVDTGYPIECLGGQHGRSGMTHAGGRLYELGQTNETKLPPITVAHEFGHCLLGASDEYANPAVPGRMLSDDHSVMADYDAQGEAQAEFKVRHFDHILTAVAAQFPGYRCALR